MVARTVCSAVALYLSRSVRRPFCMRVVVLLLLPMSIATGFAQSLVAVAAQQCVYRAGDNLRWAALDLDEDGWLPYTQWTLDPRQPRIWIRCHADLSPLASTVHPAIQVSLEAAYQLFSQGTLRGAAGDVQSGRFSQNSIQTFPIPREDLSRQADVLAIRVTYRTTDQAAPMQMFAGEQQWLSARRDSIALAASSEFLTVAICYAVIGVVGFMLLALYLSDRGRLELLLLAIVCLCLAMLRLDVFCAKALVSYSSTVETALVGIGQALLVPQVWLMFRLGRKPVPWLFRILVAIGLVHSAHFVIALFLNPGASLRLYAAYQPILFVVLVVGGIVTLAPFFAFWPWNQIAGRMRALAACAMLWGAIDSIWFAIIIARYTSPARNAYFSHWETSLLEIRALATASVIIALLALLFRDQRKTAEDGAALAGEMQAAQQIQRMLVQSPIENLAGFKIEVAFRPMREVGGDFYLCRLLPGNRQRVILGDVSGKGAAAAMTAALLIGAAERRDHDSPSALLRHMSLVLCDAQVGGFATCLCADVTEEGIVALANAGHLLPWRNGEEVSLDCGLPLGITGEATYSETSLNLRPADMLTFVSDGVVEARDAKGTLFGFDRTQSISRQPAHSIADAAQHFGQEDDITVLTLSFVPAHVRPA